MTFEQCVRLTDEEYELLGSNGQIVIDTNVGVITDQLRIKLEVSDDIARQQ